jgi:hypothetical protein
MTVTIGLITTGQCEHLALPESLTRMFADDDVEFRALFRGPADSLTSCFVSYPAPRSKAPSIADRLVQRMAAELERRHGPDFVIAVDDLELDNVDTPDHVTGVVRDAVAHAIGDVPTHSQLARFRDRCSFHLLCPMVEAYFYGEPAALERAGANASKSLTLVGTHLEDFTSGDMAFITSGGNVKHPKHYLKFLSQDSYKETRGGKSALATLDWAQVFAHQPPGLAFAHALFEDIADALGAASPFPGKAHPATERRQNGVLRNL